MSSEFPNSLDIAPGVSVPLSAIEFTFSRSSGPGGQNVNKLNTKATLTVDLEDLVESLGSPTVSRLRRLAGSRVTDDGRLIIHADESRSQVANKQSCLGRLRELIVKARYVPKRRRKTKPTRGSRERRLEQKKQRGETKHRRQQRFD